MDIIPNSEIERAAPISLNELSKKIKDQFGIESIPGAGEARKIELALAQEFIEKQIQEKERYAHIFKTEKGSTYFTLTTGECLRLRYDSGKGMTLEPITERVFFIDNEQSQALHNSVFEKIDMPEMDMSFKDDVIRVGACPVEFGIIGKSNSFSYKESNGEMTVSGTYDSFANDVHFGDKIVELIK